MRGLSAPIQKRNSASKFQWISARFCPARPLIRNFNRKTFYSFRIVPQRALFTVLRRPLFPRPLALPSINGDEMPQEDSTPKKIEVFKSSEGDLASRRAVLTATRI